MPIRKITLQRAATDKPQLGIDFIDSSFALDSSEAIQLLGFNPTLGGSFVDSAEARKLIEGDKGLTYNNTTGVFNLDSANVKSIFGTDNKGLVYSNGTFNVDSTNIKSFTVADAINNGITDVAPSQNAVFDNLALKADISLVPTLGDDFVDSVESRKLIEGDKGLVYNNATGVMSVDSTNLTELARAAIDPTSTNKGIVYNSSNGAIQVDSSNINAIADARITTALAGNIIIGGNLTVTGTSTTTISNTVNIGDNINV